MSDLIKSHPAGAGKARSRSRDLLSDRTDRTSRRRARIRAEWQPCLRAFWFPGRAPLAMDGFGFSGTTICFAIFRFMGWGGVLHMLDEHMAASFGDASAFLQGRGQFHRRFHHLGCQGQESLARIDVDRPVFAEIETFHRGAMATLKLLGEQRIGIETELQRQRDFRFNRVCGHGPFFGHHGRKCKGVLEAFDDYRVFRGSPRGFLFNSHNDERNMAASNPLPQPGERVG